VGERIVSGRIVIDLFSSLDGVQQAPGRPDEDPEGGFTLGGWQAPLLDEVAGRQVGEGIERMDALLLGRKTYDIFAAYWPTELDGSDSSIARKFDAIPKYVASRAGVDLSWRGSHLLRGDLATAVAELRERHDEVHVIGSIDLARSLVREGLFDVLNLWVYPVVLGAGKRLFPAAGPPIGLRLLEPPVASEKGTVLLRFGPGDEVRTGDMGAPDRGLSVPEPVEGGP
jgi:dihydrofolate reductase